MAGPGVDALNEAMLLCMGDEGPQGGAPHVWWRLAPNRGVQPTGPNKHTRPNAGQAAGDVPGLGAPHSSLHMALT